MKRLTAEIRFEDKIIEELNKKGWDTNYSFRRIQMDVPFDYQLLKRKIVQINKVKDSIAKKVILEIRKIGGSSIEQNYLGFNYLVNGVRIYDASLKRTMTLKLFSENLNLNHWGVIRQLPLIDSDGRERYPDIVCYLNGLPIIVTELKAPDANERLPEAFLQIDSLKRQFPSLYTFNVFVFLSNNIESKYGSITSSFNKYFNAGKWLSNTNPLFKLFYFQKIFEFINVYSFFNNDKTIKYIAAQHQIEAAESTITKMKKSDYKGGVVWHTQGSGKSITMLILSKLIIQTFHTPTILLITDRNSLNRQLFTRFSKSSKYLLNDPVEVNSRKDLINKLNNKKHYDIYFSTMQKFSSKTGKLSDRNDIFILIDEAHRTQNNIEGNKILDKKSREFITKFGFAKYMRDAFPNAILTGFTGTPLMGDKMTIDIFGSYNHKYTMSDSVADGCTVPIYYESRKVKIHLNKSYLEDMDKIQMRYAQTLENNNIESEQKMKALLKSVKIKNVLEDPDVIFAKTKNILQHLEIRKGILNGKAMIVASSRKAAFEYYKSIIKINSKIGKSTILVMSHNNKDNAQEEKMIIPKYRINEVSSEFRKSNSKYQIAIVVDMWLTGFDAPDLDVMYIDKVIRWHNLMQAIARVNRTFEENGRIKTSGLIVDYFGIWKYLSDALAQYSNVNAEVTDIIPENLEKAETKLIDEIDIIDKHYIKRISIFPLLNSKEQYQFIMKALDTILSLNQEKRNVFILKARWVARLVKIAFTILDKGTIVISKAISVVNSLLSTHNTQDDPELRITIKEIKIAIEKAVDAKESDVFIEATKIKRGIHDVALLLEEEAEQLKDASPNVAKKLLEDAINGRISEIKKYRPIFAMKASNKLRDILNRLEKDEKLEKVIEMLIQLSKDLSKKMIQPPEFDDPQLQAFFSILSDDEYLKHNKNSEVLKAIARDLMKVVKENITDQFYINKKVKEKVAFQLRKILHEKYNYPPEKLGGISGILIDRIKKTVTINSDYFVRKREII